MCDHCALVNRGFYFYSKNVGFNYRILLHVANFITFLSAPESD